MTPPNEPPKSPSNENADIRNRMSTESPRFWLGIIVPTVAVLLAATIPVIWEVLKPHIDPPVMTYKAIVHEGTFKRSALPDETLAQLAAEKNTKSPGHYYLHSIELQMQGGMKDSAWVALEFESRAGGSLWGVQVTTDNYHTDQDYAIDQSEDGRPRQLVKIELKRLYPHTHFAVYALSTDTQTPLEATSETLKMLKLENYFEHSAGWVFPIVMVAIVLAVATGLHQYVIHKKQGGTLTMTTANRLNIVVAAFLLTWLLTAASAFAQIRTGGYVLELPCKQQCDKIKEERDLMRVTGHPYISPQDIAAKKIILRITLRPDLTNGLPPVDDELYLQDVHDNVISRPWFTNLQLSRTDQPFTLTADQLTPGEHLLQLWYADTQPPDAHFFADVCGYAFRQDESCFNFREGKTFGSGIVHNNIRVVVRDSKVYVSKLPLRTGCKCP